MLIRLVFSLLILFLSAIQYSNAEILKRPGIEGYLMPANAAIIPDKGRAAQYMCDRVSMPVSRIVEIPDNRYPNWKGNWQPLLNVYCWNTGANGSRFEYQVTTPSYLEWTFYCPKGNPMRDEPSCLYNEEKTPPCFKDCGNPRVGHPINVVTGYKVLDEYDYVSPLGLNFSRFYTSRYGDWLQPRSYSLFLSKRFPEQIISKQWSSNYSKSLEFVELSKPVYLKSDFIYERVPSILSLDEEPSIFNYKNALVLNSRANYDIVHLRRPDGSQIYFQSMDQGNSWKSDSDVYYKLVILKRSELGKPLLWKLLTPRDEIEIYDENGRLISYQSRSGVVESLIYSDSSTPIHIAPNSGYLIEVVNSYNQSLKFQYDGSGYLRTLIDPSGAAFSYSYEGAILKSVTYPDGTKKIYTYNEPQFIFGSGFSKYLLTGTAFEFVDGTQRRFTNYYYEIDSNNPKKYRAIQTEKIGTEVYKIKYTNGGLNAEVTEPSGLKKCFRSGNVDGANQLQSISLCDNVNVTSIFGLSNASTRILMNDGGVNTVTTYDLTRNLETKRIEAYGKPEARTISTQWHASLRIPVQIDEPLKRTTYVYDINGNVLTKTEQATSDVNGNQGAAATVVGTPRVWAYTYNEFGQVLTAKGPRTDINDVTSYTYDTQGNLTSVTNPAGHVTSMSNYDAHGHVGTITDPNGVVTHLTYHVRGWLASRAVTADGVTETTTYTYDGVGQLTQVTLPDNSTITYTYDDAHRLTQINDHLGNRIIYTLDNMGNRIKEEIKDSTGTLTNQVTRVYDSLNRLKEITGGAQ